MAAIVFILCLFILYWWRFSTIDMPSKRILFIFILYWSISIFLFALDKGDFNSADTTILSLVSFICFIIGFSLFKIPSKFINIQDNISLQVEKILNNKIFTAILLILTLYIGNLAITQFKYLSIYSASELRTAYFDPHSSIFGNKFTVINYWILNPCCIFLSVLWGYCVFYKRTWKLFVIFICLFAYSTLGGGRFNYIRYLILPLILIFYCFNKDYIKIKFKYVATSFAIIFIVLNLFSFISGLRSGSNDKEDGEDILVEHLYSYSLYPIHAFDYAIHSNYDEKIGGYKYGLLTFSFIEDVFFQIGTKILGANPWETSLEELVEQKQKTQIRLKGGEWNALYTWNIYFYYDFHILGLIIFPFIFGILTRFFIFKFSSTPNISTLIIIFVFFKFIVFSPIDSLLRLPDILLICFLTLSSQKKIRMRIAH